MAYALDVAVGKVAPSDQESKLLPALFCLVFNLPHPSPSWRRKETEKRGGESVYEVCSSYLLKRFLVSCRIDFIYIYFWPEFSPHVTSR